MELIKLTDQKDTYACGSVAVEAIFGAGFLPHLIYKFRKDSQNLKMTGTYIAARWLDPRYGHEIRGPPGADRRVLEAADLTLQTNMEAPRFSVETGLHFYRGFLGASGCSEGV